MIIRIRLKAHPDKYIPRENTTYALADDETRRQRSDSYYREFHEHSFFVPQHQANTWTVPGNIKRTLSSSARLWHKWHETTWTEYEVEHVDTGVVEPLDVFLLPFRKGLPDPKVGDITKWAHLKKRAEAKPPTPYAIAEAIRLIPVPDQVQRQDSTTDQLITVLELARRAGCYDAYDVIKKRLMS